MSSSPKNCQCHLNRTSAPSASMSPKKPKFMNDILDDIFHINQPLCQIPKTSTTPKKDIFKTYRPKSKTCLDHDISQTDVKLDAANTKIHVQQTEAKYVPNPEKPEEKKPRKKRKIKYSSGGPPQWEFVDEIWRREQEEKQEVYRAQLVERLAKAKAAKREKARERRRKRKEKKEKAEKKKPIKI